MSMYGWLATAAKQLKNNKLRMFMYGWLATAAKQRKKGLRMWIVFDPLLSI